MRRVAVWQSVVCELPTSQHRCRQSLSCFSLFLAHSACSLLSSLSFSAHHGDPHLTYLIGFNTQPLNQYLIDRSSSILQPSLKAVECLKKRLSTKDSFQCLLTSNRPSFESTIWLLLLLSPPRVCTRHSSSDLSQEDYCSVLNSDHWSEVSVLYPFLCLIYY